MKKTTRCPNMNHGRLNVAIRFCPTCGDAFNKSGSASCNDETHARRRRDRNIFCMDCGKKLDGTSTKRT